LRDKRNRKAYRSIVDRFRVFAGCDTFEELLGLGDPRGVLLEWKDSLVISPGSVNAYVSRVKGFYAHFGVEVGFVPRVRQRVSFPHRILTVDEIRLLMKHGDIRDKALIWMLYSTGARISSVLSLTVGRIDFRGEPPVLLHFKPSETKFNVAYDTFLCAEALDALKRYIQWRRKQGECVEPSSPLFINKYRRKLRYPSSSKAIKLIVEKSGIPVGEDERLLHHSFRAAFHRNLQISGVNQYIIEKLMGHDTENTTTGRYSIGLTVDDLREAYMKADWSEGKEARMESLETKTLLQDQRIKELEETNKSLQVAIEALKDLVVSGLERMPKRT